MTTDSAIETLRQAELARKAALAAASREQREQLKAAMKESDERETARQAALAATTPELEPPTKWEQSLSAQLEFISSCGLPIGENAEIERVCSDLRRQIAALELAREFRRRARVQRLAIDETPIRIVHADIPTPDAALFVAGVRNELGMSLLLPPLEGSRKRLLVGRFVAPELVAEARAALEEQRDIVRRAKEYERQGDSRTAQEKEALIEADVDREIGFIVEGDDRWQPASLAHRAGYVGPELDRETVLAFVRRWDSAPRVATRWLQALGIEIDVDLRYRGLEHSSVAHAARAWWSEQTEGAA